MSNETDDLAWDSTLRLIKTSFRFRNAFWGFFALFIVSLTVTIVFLIRPFPDLQNASFWYYLAIGSASFAGSLLLGWLITALFARHAEVIYFSGQHSHPRNRKDVNWEPGQHVAQPTAGKLATAARAVTEPVNWPVVECTSCGAKSSAIEAKGVEVTRCPNCGAGRGFLNFGTPGGNASSTECPECRRPLAPEGECTKDKCAWKVY